MGVSVSSRRLSRAHQSLCPKRPARSREGPTSGPGWNGGEGGRAAGSGPVWFRLCLTIRSQDCRLHRSRCRLSGNCSLIPVCLPLFCFGPSGARAVPGLRELAGDRGRPRVRTSGPHRGRLWHHGPHFIAYIRHMLAAFSLLCKSLRGMCKFIRIPKERAASFVNSPILCCSFVKSLSREPPAGYYQQGPSSRGVTPGALGEGLGLFRKPSARASKRAVSSAREGQMMSPCPRYRRQTASERGGGGCSLEVHLEFTAFLAPRVSLQDAQEL